MSVSNSVKAALLILLLGFHLATRLNAASHAPWAIRSFYPRDYEVALSLMAGRGFHGLEVWDDSRPQAHGVRRFLRMLRGEVREKTLRPFLEGARAGPAPTLATSRVLDMYVAAGLWRVFGVRWSVLFAFYAVLSTFVAFLIFLIARRLGGGFGAGLLATLLFTASPYETIWATAGIRDISPLWFDTLALAALLLLIPLAPSPWSLAGCALLAGAASAVGIGWRHDGWMAPPLALAGLLVLLRSEGRGFRDTAVSVASFVAGVAVLGLALSTTGPARPLGPQIGFHIAYYGNYDRSNMLGIENSFQVLRNDLYTYQQAAYYALVTRGIPDLPYWIGEYGSVCRDLYLRTLTHNAFDWLWGYPRFFIPALAGLGPPGALQGVDPSLLEPERFAWLAPVYRWVLDPLTRALPAFFVFGGLVLLLFGPRRTEAALLIGFALLYVAVLLMVLPESKHFGPLLLPLCTVAGAGLWRASRLTVARAERLEAVRVIRQRGLTRFVGKRIALVGVGAVVVAALVAGLSLFTRRGYLAEVVRLADRGESAPETILGPRTFSFTIVPGEMPDPRGFLLTIRTGAAPGVLVCRHRRGFGDEETQRLYLTRHPLAPSATQRFFVVGLQGAFQKDGRTYRCTVMLEGDATIVESRRLDLSSWRRPIYSTVFGVRDWWPGTPRLSPGVASTEFLGFPHQPEERESDEPDEEHEPS